MSFMPKIRHIPLLVLVGIAFSAASPVFADALVKPLPQPDSSKLKPEVAKDLADARAAFEKNKINLIGDKLATAYANIGAMYARAGLNDIAAIAMYDASQLAPKNMAWLYLRGVIAREQKRTTDARADFEAAMVLNKTYLPIRYRLADTLVDLGDMNGAHKLLAEVVPKYPKNATLLSMLGRLELKQQNFPAAIQHLQQAIDAEPKANALYKDLATAYTAQGNADAAKQAQAKAGSTQPDLDDPILARLYSSHPLLHGTALEQAHQLLAQRRFRRARAKVAEAELANPKDVEAIALGARLDALLGYQQAALKGVQQALQLAPDNVDANLSQGMVYEFGGDGARAVPYYQRVLKADQNQPDAQLLLGNALMRQGKYAQAAEHYRQLSRIDPESSEASTHLVAALVAQGHCSDALNGVNTMLSKRPKDGDLMQLFVRLASTCEAASSQQRSMALDYAEALYKQRPNAEMSTALALAQAAQGKFKDAQQSQAEAIYEAIRVGDMPSARQYRETMQEFAAKKVPVRPWPADSKWFRPALLQPLPPPPQSGAGKQ